MIRHYIIDGNNLIGKIKSIWELQKKDKQASREKLAFLLDRYFSKKKIKVTLHFDGFAGDAIKTYKVKIIYSDKKTIDIFELALEFKIIYSDKKTADQKIKNQIDNLKNPKLAAVVSSDNNVKQYAKLNSCTIINSEDFAKEVLNDRNTNIEQDKINQIDNEEMKRLFGVD